MSCEFCEQQHDENESTPPCIETNEPCIHMRVELDSTLARRVWNYYWTARSPIATLLHAFEPIHVSKYDRSTIAYLLRCLNEEVMRLEEKRDEENNEEQRARDRQNRNR